MNKKKVRIAIIISGFGSNMESLINYSLKKESNYEVSLVVSNNPNALGIKKAQNKDIENIIINHKDYPSRKEFEEEVDRKIETAGCQIICLAGFTRVLTKHFTDKWVNKLINIHPSLLPKHKGMDAIKQAFDAGDSKSGCTVHYVNENIDAGEIISQQSIDINKNDTLSDVRKKVSEQELKIFPLAIDKIAKETRNA